MGIFDRKVEQPRKENLDADYLKEYANVNGINMYNFINGIRQIDTNYINTDILVERMKEDSIISSAIDMWTEDTLQRDPQTKEIFNVEVNQTKDEYEEELAKGLGEELNKFLKKDLRMEKYLIPIIKRILTYGNCVVKLDFADTLDDELLELKESNKEIYRNISEKAEDIYGEKDFTDTERLNEDCFRVDWEQFGEDIIPERKSRKLKKQPLKEGELIDLKPMIKGRWYTEILGRGTNIYELNSKQKTIAYMDRDNPDRFIRPDRIANFSNNTGKHSILFEVGDEKEIISKKKYFRLERGESFIENSMIAWQVLSALEDILLLTRMTRSILYRIFSVEVGNKGNRETKDLLDRLKNKIKMDETVDVRSKIYNSSLSQVPLGDSIFIPTRNGVGVINVDTVGGDVNLHDAIDLDYFKDKLFAGLRIPAPFLGFTESLPGGIGDTSLTRMDIRYSRTIARIQTIVAEGLKDLCKIYLKLTRTKEALNELPDFKIVFTSINSAEDTSRAELKSTQMRTLQDVLNGLNNLGVDLANNSETYEETRRQIIKEYFGAELLDKIIEDEKTEIVQGPTEGNPNDLRNRPGASNSPILSGPRSPIGTRDNNEEQPELQDNNEEEVDLDTEVSEVPEEPAGEETRELQ